MKVFFAVPAYRGVVCSQFLDSMEATVNLCTAKGIETTLSLLPGCCYVQVARNELIWQFMQSDADVLFFLDDDVSWPAQAVVDLLESDADVVAGVYPKKSDDDTAFPVVLELDAHDAPIEWGNLIEAHAVPTGFLKINRGVIENLIAAYPQQRYEVHAEGKPTRELYDLFPQGVQDGRWWGEDFAFCRLWKGIGGEIWVKPDIDFGHHAPNKSWYGNLHRYLLEHAEGKC